MLHHLLGLHSPNQGADFAGFWARRKLLKGSNEGFLLDGKRAALSLNNSYRNVLTEGAVGTGKTSIGVIPTLLRQLPSSKVVIDTKGTIYQKTAPYLASQGFEIEVFDLHSPSQSRVRYNPLAQCDDLLSLHQAVRQVVYAGKPASPGDAFWNDGAVSLLAVLAFCLRRQDPSQCTLANLKKHVAQFDVFNAKPGESVTDRFICKFAHDASEVMTEYRAFTGGNEATILSWVSTAANALTPLLSPQLAELTATSTFPFDQLRKRKSILYVKVNQKDLDFYAFLLNLFFCDLLAALTHEITDEGFPVLLMLDEFGQFSINRFETYIAIAREYRVGIWIFLQTLAQLDERYGRDRAKIIKNNLTTKTFFGGMEIETAEMLSKRLGVRKVARRDGEGLIFAHEPLMTPAELIQLNDQELIVCHGNRPPMKIKGTPYFKNSKLSSRISPKRRQI